MTAETIKKFKFKGDAIVLHPPQQLVDSFVNHGFGLHFPENEKSKNTVAFISNRNDFLNFVKEGLSRVEYDSVLWIAYPKGTSKIKTDIHRDILRELGEQFGIITVAAIAIDETWSALRFRPVDKVGK